MLKNAKNYKDKLDRLFADTVYDINYQYYYGDNICEISYPENACYHHCFVSVDKNDNVIGYFSYQINRSTKRAYNFYAISFDRGNIIYTKDILCGIRDIFLKYGVSTICFAAFVDNPITPTYTKLVEKHGGRVVGVMHNVSILQDGRLHDLILYEINLWGYISSMEGIKNV